MKKTRFILLLNYIAVFFHRRSLSTKMKQKWWFFSRNIRNNTNSVIIICNNRNRIIIKSMGLPHCEFTPQRQRQQQTKRNKFTQNEFINNNPDSRERTSATPKETRDDTTQANEFFNLFTKKEAKNYFRLCIHIVRQQRRWAHRVSIKNSCVPVSHLATYCQRPKPIT